MLIQGMTQLMQSYRRINTFKSNDESPTIEATKKNEIKLDITDMEPCGPGSKIKQITDKNERKEIEKNIKKTIKEKKKSKTK